MAKRKTTAATDDNGDEEARVTPHRTRLESEGYVRLSVARPRKKPYTFEEWLSPGRRLAVVKALDNGNYTIYHEQQQTADPEELTRSMR